MWYIRTSYTGLDFYNWMILATSVVAGLGACVGGAIGVVWMGHRREQKRKTYPENRSR